MNAGELVRQLLTTGTVSVVTARDGAPLEENTALDAVTIIQLDGDVVNYFRDGAELDRHFAALRRARALLRRLELCWGVTSRGVFWGALLAAQYPAHGWALRAVMSDASGALGEAVSQPEHWLRSAGGVLAWFALRALAPLAHRLIRRALSKRSVDVFSARFAHQR